MPISGPAFQFYAADFLTDEKVARMTLAERGLYITLLCHEWAEGSIPADIAELSRLVREPLGSLRKLWREVSKCFEPDGNGRLTNLRMERGRIAKLEYLEKQRQAGLRGAGRRWGGDTVAIGSPEQSISNPNGNPNGNPTATPLRLLKPNDSSPSPSPTPSPSPKEITTTPAVAGLGGGRRVAVDYPEVDFGDQERAVKAFFAMACSKRLDGKMSSSLVARLRVELHRIWSELGPERFVFGIEQAVKAEADAPGYVRKAAANWKNQPLTLLAPKPPLRVTELATTVPDMTNRGM